MFKKSASLLFILLFLQSCGGRVAQPVIIHQFGDEEKSCNMLETELFYVEKRVYKLLEETEKLNKTTLVAAGGIFVATPIWIFLDFSEAEKIEIEAFRKRYNHLVTIGNNKNCDLKRDTVPQIYDVDY